MKELEDLGIEPPDRGPAHLQPDKMREAMEQLAERIAPVATT